eukprot:TRINITY_DN14726_c0_g1_i2.p1 TRINITY_DN14726_c0_g1~~TRINITY_DN14726_c0_g1_i2.p1  ORF type:complete len:250 (+),score=29.43 TRINITY_DN14726_c0_g1_i2:232-981(+)
MKQYITVLGKLAQNKLLYSRIVEKNQCSRITKLCLNQKFFFSHEHDSLQCWNCHNTKRKTNLFICSNCDYILDPECTVKHQDFFTLFGLEKNFEVNLSKLESLYKQYVANYHPDKFSKFNSKQATLYSETMTSYIIQAYSTLRNNISRAEYILKLSGFENKLESDTGAKNAKFLQQMLLMREQIEDCDNKAKLSLLKNAIEQEQAQTVYKLSQLLKQKSYEQANAQISTLRYLESSMDAILKKEEQLSN